MMSLQELHTNSDKVLGSRWSSAVTTISIWRRKSSHWIDTRGEKTMIRRNIERYIHYAYVSKDSHFVVVTRIWYKRTMSLERMKFFSWTRSIHYADGYESFLIKLMYIFTVFEMKDRKCSVRFAYYDVKGSRRKGDIYISFTRYPHDLRIERGSRDYTLSQIEDSDTSYLDTCHDLNNVFVTAVASGKKKSHGALLSSRRPCLFRWRRPDWTRDIVRRIRSASRSWTLILGRILLGTDILMKHAELSVAMRTLDE